VKSSCSPLPPLKSAKVLDQLHDRIRYWHYSIRTADVYVHWVRTFLRFHGLRQPATMGQGKVEAIPSWIASTRNVFASTKMQALSALHFFYGMVLGSVLPRMSEIGRPRTRRQCPPMSALTCRLGHLRRAVCKWLAK
jgi:hypothetical protein